MTKQFTYSDQEMRDIERSSERLRAYFWRVAQNAKRLARRDRAASRSISLNHPTSNYRPQFSEGFDLLKDAEHMERFSSAILENLDALVRSTVVE